MDELQHKREFEDRGFTVCRGFFSREEAIGALEEIQRVGLLTPSASGLNKSQLTFYNNNFHHSQYIQSFISQKKVVNLLRDIIGPDIWARWDQAVAKPPGGEEFPWHQDNGYNRLKEQHFQFWVALTDMKPEHGLLWLQPGSHKGGVLSHHQEGNHLVCPGNPENAVSIEAQQGDVILFSSLMLHRTSPNVSKESRWAYVVEYMSLDQYDPFIDPPYFVVARGGKPCPEFLHYRPGRANPRNQAMYLIPRLRHGIQKRVREPLENLRLKILQSTRRG
jgi:hypothetical protein